VEKGAGARRSANDCTVSFLRRRNLSARGVPKGLLLGWRISRWKGRRRRMSCDVRGVGDMVGEEAKKASRYLCQRGCRSRYAMMRGDRERFGSGRGGRE